ncbi:MAG: copper chaperone PCu(A)C [Paracraurococcus sp.]
MPKLTLTRATFLAAAFTAACGVLPARAADITVQQPWSRAAMQGGVGGAFMKIENGGTAPDRLVSASSPVARTVELHTTIRDGDVMRMRPVTAIEVPAHGTVQLQPGGLHVMLIGLNKALTQGEQVPLTLTFERAGQVAVSLPIQGAGAMGGDMGSMQGHGATAPAPRH